MTAIDEEIFDDLLIGNFIRTTLHGRWDIPLGRSFTPFVTKYADNGRARCLEELQHYFAAYHRRSRAYAEPGQADDDLVGLIDMITARLAAKTSDERP